VGHARPVLSLHAKVRHKMVITFVHPPSTIHRTNLEVVVVDLEESEVGHCGLELFFCFVFLSTLRWGIVPDQPLNHHNTKIPYKPFQPIKSPRERATISS